VNYRRRREGEKGRGVGWDDYEGDVTASVLCVSSFAVLIEETSMCDWHADQGKTLADSMKNTVNVNCRRYLIMSSALWSPKWESEILWRFITAL